MDELEIRKIGHEVGVIFPKEWQLEAGDTIEYFRQGDKIILKVEDGKLKRERDLIENSFADFENGLHVTEEEMAEEFRKDGWGQ